MANEASHRDGWRLVVLLRGLRSGDSGDRGTSVQWPVWIGEPASPPAHVHVTRLELRFVAHNGVSDRTLPSSMSTGPKDQDALTAGHRFAPAPRQPKPREALWYFVRADHVRWLAELVDDACTGSTSRSVATRSFRTRYDFRHGTSPSRGRDSNARCSSDSRAISVRE